MLLGRATRAMKPRVAVGLPAIIVLLSYGTPAAHAEAQPAPSFRVGAGHHTPTGTTVHVASVNPCPPVPDGVTPSVMVASGPPDPGAPSISSFPLASDGSWAGDIVVSNQPTEQFRFDAQCPGMTTPLARTTLSVTTSGQGSWLLFSGPTLAPGRPTATYLEPFGDARSVQYAGTPGIPNSARPVAAAANPSTGLGEWIVDVAGGVYAFGDAPFLGSMGGQPLNQPIVGMAATASGRGYWLVASDGGIFTFGDAPFLGSMGGQPLSRPIVGMAATASGRGYWLVASDGGIFAFGDAGFLGSTGGQQLGQPIVGMAASRSGLGYWLVASDGGIFTFGDAPFLGSRGGQPLTAPIVGMAAFGPRDGYWMAASDGTVFSFGFAPDLGFGDQASTYRQEQPMPTTLGIIASPVTTPG